MVIHMLDEYLPGVEIEQDQQSMGITVRWGVMAQKIYTGMALEGSLSDQPKLVQQIAASLIRNIKSQVDSTYNSILQQPTPQQLNRAVRDLLSSQKYDSTYALMGEVDKIFGEDYDLSDTYPADPVYDPHVDREGISTLNLPCENCRQIWRVSFSQHVDFDHDMTIRKCYNCKDDLKIQIFGQSNDCILGISRQHHGV